MGPFHVRFCLSNFGDLFSAMLGHFGIPGNCSESALIGNGVFYINKLRRIWELDGGFCIIGKLGSAKIVSSKIISSNTVNSEDR
jgi:hypothetical protein